MKSKQELFSSVIQYFTSNYDVKAAGAQNIRLGSKSQTPLQFHKRFVSEKDDIAVHCGRSDFFRLVDELEADKGWKEDKIFEFMADQVFGALQTRVKTAAKKKVTQADENEMVENSFQWAHHLPVIDIKSKQSLMFDTTQKCVDHETSFVAWREWVNTRPADEKKLLLATVTPASIVYDPRNTEEVQYKDIGAQKKVLHLNAHRTPDWRKAPLQNPVLHPMFKELMGHLFADQESIDYVYAWLYFMLTERNHCYLLLHGDQGLGKTSFAMICSALVGSSNYSLIGPEFWESRFNHELKYKRLCFFDETIVTHDNTTSIRALTNKYIRIEEKNVNAIDLENHASFIIANNTEKTNQLYYEDRRFSVPNMGRGKIVNVLGQEWLDRFYNLMENDPQFIANIGCWILKNGDSGKYSNTQPFLSDTFYELVDKAMSIWQKNIIELLETKQTDRYELADLTEELRGTGRVKLKAFLDSHRDRDGNQYGYVGQDADGKRYVYATDHYRPAGEFDTVDF